MQPITTLTTSPHSLRFGRNERPSPAPAEPIEQPMERGENAANRQPLPPIHLPVGPTQLGQGGALNFFYHNPDSGHVQRSHDIVALLDLAIAGERELQNASSSEEVSEGEDGQLPEEGHSRPLLFSAEDTVSPFELATPPFFLPSEAILGLAARAEGRGSHSNRHRPTDQNGQVVLNPQGGGYHSAFYELA